MQTKIERSKIRDDDGCDAAVAVPLFCFRAEQLFITLIDAGWIDAMLYCLVLIIVMLLLIIILHGYNEY